MRLKVTLELDEKWASYQTKEELIESLRSRLDTSLGFRGNIDKLKLVEKRPKAARKGKV
jgi:hypothetical protein